MARTHPATSSAALDARSRLPAAAAAAWATVFAAASAYWAAGGTGGSATIANDLAERAAARDPGFVATLWTAAALKLLLAALALALARPVAGRLESAVRFAGWASGTALALYGSLVGLVEFVSMGLGVREVRAGIGHAAVAWYIFLWEPAWVLGGLLFLAAARTAPRPQRLRWFPGSLDHG
jgi:hypothetical protein